eukprot:scaffold1461_cov39-Cyclotella_meneghiniana.AAC.2
MSRRTNNEASLQDIQNSINQLATNTNNAISDLAAQVQALAAAASANAANLQQLQLNQQQAGGQGAPQATVTFATSPGTSNQSVVINYGTRYGMALYDMGIKPLFDSEETKFDLENEGALNFEKAVERRAKNMGWYDDQQGILTFNVDGEDLDLLSDYGRIESDAIKTQSEPVFMHNGAKRNARAAQNNDMMQTMLFDSLTTNAQTRVAVFKDEYEFANGGNPEKKIIVAAALYKVIMKLTTLDTKNTDKALRISIII